MIDNWVAFYDSSLEKIIRMIDNWVAFYDSSLEKKNKTV